MISENAIVRVTLAGARTFAMEAKADATALTELAGAAGLVSRNFDRATGKSFLMNQAIFTARRLTYGLSLGFIAAGAEAVKMGFEYNSTMQTAQAMLRPLFSDSRALQREMTSLFRLAALTPFQFQDITKSFALMFPPLQKLGYTSVEVTQLMQGLSNALSQSFKATPAALNRVSVQLQHLAFMGRLTGQMVFNLARDGLPIYDILRTRFGLAADQLHNVGQMGISAQEVLKQITWYLTHVQPYSTAAFRFQTRTLVGGITTFKDFLSQAMGSAQQGMFSGLTRVFQRVDNELGKMSAKGPLTLHKFAVAIDQVLTPRTHGVMQLFRTANEFLSNFLRLITTIGNEIFRSALFWGTIIITLKVFAGLFAMVNFLLAHFHFPLFQILAAAFVMSEAAFVLSRFIMLVWRATLLSRLYALYKDKETQAELRNRLAVWQARTAKLAGIIATQAQIFWERMLGITVIRNVYAFLAYRIVLARVAIEQALLAIKTRISTIATITWTAVTGIATGVATVFDAAVMALALSLGLTAIALYAIVAVVVLVVAGLVILYFRWGAFHDLVNRTFYWIKDHWKLLLAILLSPFAVAIYEIIKHFSAARSAITSWWNWIKNLFKAPLDIVIRIHTHTPGVGDIPFIGPILKKAQAITVPLERKALELTGTLPKGQHGANVIQAGSMIVGERGPEILSLPKAASVVPLSHAGYDWPDSGMRPFKIEVYPQAIYLDGKRVGTVLAKAITDAEARS